MILYHGSEKNIDKFVIDFVGQEQAKDQEGPGIYLTTSKKDAEMYGENVHMVQLSDDVKLIGNKKKKPSIYVIIKLIKMSSDWEMSAQNWDEDENIGVIAAAKSALEHNDSTKDTFLQVWIDFYRYRPTEFVKNMVKLGIDGLLVDKEHGGVQHVILYNVDKIISVEKIDGSIKEFVKKTIMDEIKKRRRKKKKIVHKYPMNYPYGMFGGFGGNFGASMDYGGIDSGDAGGDGGGGE